MRKKLLLTLCIILAGLLPSCSELVLPKNAEISGTLKIPINTRVSNLNSLYTEVMEKAFSNDREETKGLKVYAVDYQGQTIEAFCIYVPIEMTEDLNPDHFLKTINTQINDGLSAEPKSVTAPPVMVPSTGPILPEIMVDLSEANDLIKIPPVSLEEISRYVISIEFDECDGTTTSGIGINFNVTEIIPGIKMTLKCEELGINESKILVEGDNVFGNHTALTGNNALFMREGRAGRMVDTLNFKIELKSAADSNILPVSTAGYSAGQEIIMYKGEIDFFNKWVKATIDMHEAVRGEEGLTGVFPQDQEDGFDLSELGGYFDGFTFEGLEARMYISGSPIRGLYPSLKLSAKYIGLEDPLPLYEDSFEIDSTPLVLDDVYITNECYNSQHLPGTHDDIPGFEICKDTLTDIFITMPEGLFFGYELGLGDEVEVEPWFFDDPTKYDSSKIAPALLIMLPLKLTATTDNSTISFPGMFDDTNDLFDRDKPEELFSSMDIKTLTMTVDFLESFFSGGSLFLDGNKETDPLLFYPDGIKLNGKKVILDFDKTQRKIVEGQLIKPNIWMKFKKDGEVVIPKHLGLISISFEIGGVLNLGEMLE
jgi:hypothetical protein